jgi:hypothetical protein
MINESSISSFELEFQGLYSQLVSIQKQIKEKLEKYSDGKNLKGDELVGWLGEIYGKLLLNGTLVSDREEYDFITPDNWRVSVKTRKGFNLGWKQTSAIPKYDGENCPTHLMFVHLNDDYSLDRIWLFEWNFLIQEKRFKEHTVRGNHRSFIFLLEENYDKEFIVFPKVQEKKVLPTNQRNHPKEEHRIIDIRERAESWLRQHFPSEIGNDFRASKFHEPQQVWFFTFPKTFFAESKENKHVNILCEKPDKANEFYYLRVPYEYFRQNQQRFSTRNSGEIFDLHISAKNNQWFVDVRGKNVGFGKFLIG